MRNIKLNLKFFFFDAFHVIADFDLLFKFDFQRNITILMLCMRKTNSKSRVRKIINLIIL